MKSIVYILIAVFVGSILVNAIPPSVPKSNKSVIIQCVDPNYNKTDFTESCSIIKKRLLEFGVANFEIVLNEATLVANINFKSEVDLAAISPLLTQRGKLEFYETFKSLNVIKSLPENSKLFSLLNIPKNEDKLDSNSAILGYCKESDKTSVDLYNINHYKSKSGKGIKFAWSQFADEEENYYLYLLKHSAAIDKSVVAESLVGKNSLTNNFELSIVFNKAGEQKWATLTKSNLGKSIAFVMDNKVYFAPKVMEEINGGKCNISGNFSASELKCLSALINNKELPLKFELID